ncbi:hypothetical protein A79_5766 [Vibrio parahaemolyticus AQ3810]|nr:hypothetical protein A79_5766 [Vibrio parahaemolyticus AQ3810]
MKDLASSLQNIGLRVKIKNGKIVVRLDGLSNPVSIVKDIAADEYKVKTNDSILSIVACFLLFSGLAGSLLKMPFEIVERANMPTTIFAFIRLSTWQLSNLNFSGWPIFN